MLKITQEHFEPVLAILKIEHSINPQTIQAGLASLSAPCHGI